MSSGMLNLATHLQLITNPELAWLCHVWLYYKTAPYKLHNMHI